MDTRVNLPKIEKHVSVEDLLFGLMKVDSTSGNEGNVGQVLSNWLQLHGWHVKQQTDPKNQHRFNVLATRKPLDEMYGKIAVVLNSHIDTVPPYIPPDLNTDGTIIKGRGSCDAKGQVVAMCHAANRLDEKLKEKVALLFVYSEETDHQGAKDCNALNLNPTTAIIVGEPTERKLATSQKGIVKINLTSVGKAAHSGYPEKGIDALGPMLDVLQDLRNFEWPVDEKLGKTTMNIGVLHSGRASNIIPDRAECQILFRVVTNTQEIMDSIHKILKNRVEVAVVTANEPVVLDTLPGFETYVAAFNTDIPYIKVHENCKAFLYGAGSITDAHSEWEFIKVEDLRKLVDDYKKMVEMVLTGDGCV